MAAFLPGQGFLFASEGSTVNRVVNFFQSIRIDPLYSVLGILLVLGGIMVLVRIWVSKRRFVRWKHVWGLRSVRKDKEEMEKDGK